MKNCNHCDVRRAGSKAVQSNTLRWCLSDSAVTSRQHAAMDFRARRLSHQSNQFDLSLTAGCRESDRNKRVWSCCCGLCSARSLNIDKLWDILIYINIYNIIWYWNILNTCMLRHFRDGFTPEYSILKVSHTHCADVLLYSYTTCWRTTAEYHQWNDANLSVGDHNLLT